MCAVLKFQICLYLSKSDFENDTCCHLLVAKMTLDFSNGMLSELMNLDADESNELWMNSNAKCNGHEE